jgi:hypothetical protein
VNAEALNSGLLLAVIEQLQCALPYSWLVCSVLVCSVLGWDGRTTGLSLTVLCDCSGGVIGKFDRKNSLANILYTLSSSIG